MRRPFPFFDQQNMAIHAGTPSRSTRQAGWFLMLLLLLSPLLASCGSGMDGAMPMDSGAGGAGGAGGICNAPAKIFGAPGTIGRCNFCHTAGGTPPDLTTPHVTGASESLFSKCTGQAFINTTDRPASVILKRIMGTTCGDEMPLGLVLNAADMACVTSWVNGQP